MDGKENALDNDCLADLYIKTRPPLAREEFLEPVHKRDILKLDKELEELCQALIILTSKPEVEDVVSSLPRHSVNDSHDDSAESEKTPLLPRNAQQKEHDESPSPPDGGWGWIVVASTFYINFMIAGLLRSYGVLLTAIAGHFPHSSTALVAWVPGIMGTASYVLSPISGALCERFGCRPVVFAGGLLAAIGTGLCYFLLSVPFLIFTGGLLTGIGFTLCMTPCLLIVGLYFNRHRALANSLSSAGSAAGGLVMPHVIRVSLVTFNLNGSFLLLGGLMLTISLASLLLAPLHKGSKKLCPRQETSPQSRLTRISQAISLDMLYNPVFAVLTLSVIFMSAGSPHVLYFLPAYAEELGLSNLKSLGDCGP